MLDLCGIDFEDFMQKLTIVRKKLKSIEQMRSLWLEEKNSHAKVYRIITAYYFRKHSLPYIFNSRVENYPVHLKYRYKIMEGVSDPNNFSRMKEYD